MECIITDLNSVCRGCGFFESDTNVNNGYGCNHKDNSEWTVLDSDDFPITIREDAIIAKSYTKRNIKCNRRLAKKFIKKANKENWRETLESLGYKIQGACFDFSCPIAWTVDFESLQEGNYINSKEYDYIETKEDLPWGFGDDLMGIEKTEADKLNIHY